MAFVQDGLTHGILYTDFYQLTMAQLYFKMGMHETNAQFEYFFRTCPDYGAHKAGYCIMAGTSWLQEWMSDVKVDKQSIQKLRDHTGKSGKPIFSDDFLDWFEENGNFNRITMEGIAEGRVIHPNVPALVVRGPLAMAQILESPLLNHMNYPILIATKASRVKRAGADKMTIEFGMRRAQSEAANAGARAALIGGADFTSNTGISYKLGLPPKGTHAHSMVQAFMSLGRGELEAFRAYADVYPDNCILLVDTINTLESGIPNAIKVFEELRSKGHTPVGIRLDSGDLAYLSIQASMMLDKAGFGDVSIVLSNKLDELVLMQIIKQIKEEAPPAGVDPDKLINRLVYGVGTRLITSRGEGALDGVYKLTAIEQEGKWIPALKLSETPGKTLNPGKKNVWRLYDKNNKAIADCLSTGDEDLRTYSSIHLHHPVDYTRSRALDATSLGRIEQLHVPLFKNGGIREKEASIDQMRKIRRADEEYLDSGVKRFINPHIYHVSLTRKLWELKQDLIEQAKK
ncbi:MAG: nicotinate phosphoribosyltransferase [Chitinivibrionales bacterium]|nr:nicotinate phosphoribosyltransferase [Chitinivibrionales bacterium]